MERAVPTELNSLLSHAEWLRGLALRLVHDSSAADDLVQETWLAALKNPPDPARPARPWLAGVLRNLARMGARTEARRRARQAQAARRDELPSTVELVERVDTQRRLAEVVLALSEPYRTTVLLRYFEGLSAAEIARRQGVAAGTVRWRLKHGIDELRERLDREWSTRGAWCLALGALGDTEQAILGAGATAAAGAKALLGSVASVLFTKAFGVALLLTALFGGGWALVRSSAAHTVFAGPRALATEAPSNTRGVPALAAPEAQSSGREAAVVASAGMFVNATREADPLVLEVIESDGRAAGGVLVMLDDGSADGQAARTDEAGRVHFEPGQGSGMVYVRREGAYLHRALVALEPGARSVHMPAGESVSGRLSIDGAQPVGVRLTLATDHVLFGDGSVPPAVTQRLGAGRRANAVPAANGNFHFRGLAADWAGRLLWGQDYVRAGRSGFDVDDYQFHLDAPQGSVELSLARLPRIEGVLLRANGDLQADARVQFEFERAGGKPPHALRVRTDARGSFLAPVPVLERSVLEFRVTGPTGETFAGRAPNHQVQGRIQLGRVQLRAVEAASAPYTACALDIQISGRDSEPEVAHEVLVEVATDRQLFADPEWAISSVRDAAIAPDEARRRGVFETSKGALILSGLATGVPFRLRLLDGLERQFHSENIAPLGAGAFHFPFVLDLPRSHCSGIVVDPDGNRIANARVLFRDDRSGATRTAATGSTGGFALHSLLPEPITVIAEKRGYLRTTLSVLPGRDSDALAVVLGQARDVRVVVIEDKGGAGCSVRAQDPLSGMEWEAVMGVDADGQREFELLDVPVLDLDIVVTVDGSETPARVACGASELVVDLSGSPASER